MARKKTPTIRLSVKAAISQRLREVRCDLFGEHGGPEMARRLNLPARTWYNYETGVTVPAEVLLGFIDQTGANPVWLLNGDGPKYLRGLEASPLTDLSAEQLIRRSLEKLDEQPDVLASASGQRLAAQSDEEFVAIGLVPIAALSARDPLAQGTEGFVRANRPWIPHPAETFAVRLADDAMHPILPIGSVVAVDRSERDPSRLQGRIVAARPDGPAVIRWLDLSGRHLILRPNQPGRGHPIIPAELEGPGFSPILGQVVWSWSRFAEP